MGLGALSVALLSGLAHGQARTEDEAVREALQRVPGQVLSVRPVERVSDGEAAVKVRILTEQGRVRTVRVPLIDDAGTGLRAPGAGATIDDEDAETLDAAPWGAPPGRR